jgi:hypothetical protein
VLWEPELALVPALVPELVLVLAPVPGLELELGLVLAPVPGLEPGLALVRRRQAIEA